MATVWVQGSWCLICRLAIPVLWCGGDVFETCCSIRRRGCAISAAPLARRCPRWGSVPSWSFASQHPSRGERMEIALVFSVGWMYWIHSDLACKLFSIVSLALVNVFIFLNIQAVIKWISSLFCFERPFYEQVPKFSFCLLRIAIYFSTISLLHCFLCYYDGPV